jgi:carotenoid cleavage dioxygenase-like enzyme
MPEKYGLLRSLTKSAQEPVEATIRGEIPEWVSGTLFRNGPGRFDYDDKSFKHLFDGNSCIHKFKIENGKVTYSNKFQETKSYTQAVNENRLLAFGTEDVCSTLFGRIKSFFYPPETSDNTNVNIMPYGKLFFLKNQSSIISQMISNSNKPISNCMR